MYVMRWSRLQLIANHFNKGWLRISEPLEGLVGQVTLEWDQKDQTESHRGPFLKAFFLLSIVVNNH